MTAEHFEASMDLLTSRIPFKPFTVELITGGCLEIDHPRTLVSRDGKGVFVAPGGILVFVDHESVHQIVDAPARTVRRKSNK